MRAHGQCLADRVHQVAEIEADLFEGQASALDLGEIEHVIDQLQQRVAVIRHHVEELALLLVEFGLADQIGHPEDRRHRGANLVRHAGQKFRLGARRGQRRLARVD